MLRTNIDREWYFMDGKPSDIPGMAAPERLVNLPHDFMIETDTYQDAAGGPLTGYYDGGVGTYTKYLDIPEDYTDKKVIIEFDGSYMNTTVSLNGHMVTRHHYGYTPFHADLTPYMKAGEKNRLMVTVNNEAQPNARWYTGSGLYRHVDMLVSPRIHIAPWGIYAITSHIVDGTAFVTVEVTVENETHEAKGVWVFVQFEEEAGNTTGIGKVKVHALANQKTVGRVQVMVENAKCWDIDSPDLYRIEARLEEEEGVLDTDNTTFGIRSISLDVKNGFRLNGRSIKLKGGCIHHDNGILGAISLKDSEYRKMKIHKDNGYNAIRFAHNPMSRDLLDACDRLGLLVMDEAFDVWTMEKNIHDYALYFEQDWEQDLEAFLLRDRNHPSVIMWSIGNEIPERGGLSNGYTWAAKLADFVRKYDSGRYVTSALCSFFNGLDDMDKEKFWQSLHQESQSGVGNAVNLDNQFGKSVWNSYTESYAAPLDIIGYNYLNYHYGAAKELFPNRVICCTESKPQEMESYWADVERFSHVIGDFNWTSHDYLGEAGIGKQLYLEPEKAEKDARMLHVHPFPWRTSNDADFDLCGFERPQSAYRRIIWGSNETFIASHNPKNHDLVEILGRWGWPDVKNHWTWQECEGQAVKVEVYSAADEVELLLNGESLGRAKAGADNHYKGIFELTYAPGILEAISYKDEKIVSTDKVITARKPTALQIRTDKSELIADGQSLSFAVIEVVDKDGIRVPYVEQNATAKIEGPATLAAFGTGNPVTEENYTKGEFNAYKGRMLAIIRSGYEAGNVVLTVRIDEPGVPSSEIHLSTI